MKLSSRSTSLKRRIRQYYALLNGHDFKGAFALVDPHIRRSPNSVTSFQYESALARFFESHRRIAVQAIDVQLHVGEPTTLYEDRDFALGKTTWLDDSGEQHVFLERWVRDGRTWYTRSTGLVATASPKKANGRSPRTKAS